MEETDRSVDNLLRDKGNDLESNYDTLLDESAIEDLYRLYVEEKMTQDEVGDELGFSQHHVSVALREHGISTRDKNDYDNTSVNIKTWSKGYERVYNSGDVLYHHRLIAVAEYGFDSVSGRVVHHKNELSWDNRPENLEIMTFEEHSSKHRKKEVESGKKLEKRFYE